MPDNVKSEILLDKLFLQLESFQEGFNILSNSKNLEEIGKNFVHLLRGNILVVDINLYYKEKKRFRMATFICSKQR